MPLSQLCSYVSSSDEPPATPPDPRTTTHELRPTNHELRTTNYDPRFPKFPRLDFPPHHQLTCTKPYNSPHPVPNSRRNVTFCFTPTSCRCRRPPRRSQRRRRLLVLHHRRGLRLRLPRRRRIPGLRPRRPAPPRLAPGTLYVPRRRHAPTPQHPPPRYRRHPSTRSHLRQPLFRRPARRRPPPPISCHLHRSLQLGRRVRRHRRTGLARHHHPRHPLPQRPRPAAAAASRTARERFLPRFPRPVCQRCARRPDSHRRMAPRRATAGWTLSRPHPRRSRLQWQDHRRTYPPLPH